MKKLFLIGIMTVIFFLIACETKAIDTFSDNLSPEGTETNSPTSTNTPTETVASTPTITKIPVLTETPIPLPENISDILEFNRWLDHYYYAFNGNEFSDITGQNIIDLKNEIIMNRYEYFQTHNIKGEKITFVVIDNIPIAYQDKYGVWHEATLKKMGDFSGLEIGSLMSPHVAPSSHFWKDEYHLGAISVPSNEIPPKSRKMDWGWNNYQLKFARQNDLEKTRLHMVLFPNDVPEWFNDQSTLEDLDYLVSIVVNYAKEKSIDELVVVGEATYCFSDEFCDPYFKNFGIDYIVRAFQLTRDLYPEATLIYEDAFNHIPGSISTEKTMEIAQILNEQGLIDYVGLEMHIDLNSLPDKEDLLDLILQYPVPVVMTSFSAKLDTLPQPQRQEMMNNITQVVFDTCLESPNCASISTWGESDKGAWENRSSLFDKYFQRKSAYYIAMQSMYSHLAGE